MKNVCFGCRVCEFVCKKNAIDIIKDEFGFLYAKKNENCINCGLCDSKCPISKRYTVNIIKSYMAKNKNLKIRENSSSGGVFYELANKIIKNKGIVFGAVFDKDWNVVITHTDNDFSKMLRSKYVMSDIGNSYYECKNFLDEGKTVLYTGTPCQIFGLKHFLGKEYNNLYTVDVFCHGMPSNIVWQNYLNSFNKKVIDVNFRDKKESWENFYITIKFEDGSELSESHKTNHYMQLFLKEDILKQSCYTCHLRGESFADISIGDFWGIDKQDKNFNDHKGVSAVLVRTQKGVSLFGHINMEIKECSYDFIKKRSILFKSYPIPDNRRKIESFIRNPKIAIQTNQVNSNVGGILQAYALQEKVKEILPECEVTFINQKDNGHLSFFDKKCVWTTKNGDNCQYTHLIVGSDQIWNHNAPSVRRIPLNDRYLNRNIYRRIAYAVSYAHHQFNIPEKDIEIIKESLSKTDFVSTREKSGVLFTKMLFGKNAIDVIDPTMLHEKDFYLNSIGIKEEKNNKGIFVYLLDKNKDTYDFVKKISKDLQEEVLSFDGSCENFIENFNNAKCIITDSYHGTIFSLIFNKPFISYKNVSRGNDRFDDLEIRFNIKKRLVTDFKNVDKNLLLVQPNENDKIKKYRKDSISFLKKALINI